HRDALLWCRYRVFRPPDLPTPGNVACENRNQSIILVMGSPTWGSWLMATAEALITAEEYRRLPDNGQPTELVRGRIVPLNMPTPRHGHICAETVYHLRRFLEDQDLGRVVSNDSGIVTERDPDTVRGADVAFYSYARVPKGPWPKGYLGVVPELA